MVSLVKREFGLAWGVMKQQEWPAAVLHRSRLEDPDTRRHWSQVHSNLFCSMCFIRQPEHVLKCRHAICDLCAETYGDVRLGEEYAYVLRDCTSCGMPSNLLVCLKPPTAGLRILSVDGGGVRGIVPTRISQPPPELVRLCLPCSRVL